MPDQMTPQQIREMRQALDDLLGVFLNSAPRLADAPAARRAKEVLVRIPPHAGWQDPNRRRRADEFITGSD